VLDGTTPLERLTGNPNQPAGARSAHEDFPEGIQDRSVLTGKPGSAFESHQSLSSSPVLAMQYDSNAE